MAVNVKNLKRTGKGTPPAPASAAVTIKKTNGKNVPLQLNVPEDVRRDFRVYAAQHDLDMSVLFAIVFQEYKEKHG